MQHIFVTLYYVQWLGMMWSGGAMEESSCYEIEQQADDGWNDEKCCHVRNQKLSLNQSQRQQL